MTGPTEPVSPPPDFWNAVARLQAAARAVCEFWETDVPGGVGAMDARVRELRASFPLIPKETEQDD